MRVIIPCDGDADRWNNYRNTPKQLIYLEGQTLLERTISLCRKHGVEDIWVIASDNKPKIQKVAEDMGASIAEAVRHECPVGIDKVMSSAWLWDGLQVTVLFGDVFFTEEAMDTIIKGKRETPITFYGRMHPSEITGKRGTEVYGLRVEPEGYQMLKAHCEYIRWSIQAGYIDWRKDVIQTVLASIHHHSYEKEGCDSSEWLETIDDWTEDFDRPKDYIVWKRERDAEVGFEPT